MFKRKPKKLTLRQVHSLYLLLRHALPERDEELLIDEIDRMVEKISGDDVVFRAIEIMYSKKIKGNPLEVLLLFIQGLKRCDFFEYVSFVRNVKQGK